MFHILTAVRVTRPSHLESSELIVHRHRSTFWIHDVPPKEALGKDDATPRPLRKRFLVILQAREATYWRSRSFYMGFTAAFC